MNTWRALFRLWTRGAVYSARARALRAPLTPPDNSLRDFGVAFRNLCNVVARNLEREKEWRRAAAEAATSEAWKG